VCVRGCACACVRVCVHVCACVCRDLLSRYTSRAVAPTAPSASSTIRTLPWTFHPRSCEPRAIHCGLGCVSLENASTYVLTACNMCGPMEQVRTRLPGKRPPSNVVHPRPPQHDRLAFKILNLSSRRPKRSLTLTTIPCVSTQP
jgi:hypothetical protein